VGLPSFSPDSKKITFVSSRTGNEEVYVMDRDGSDQTRLTNYPASDRAFDWQPLTQESRGMVVHPPHTGGPLLPWVANTLLFAGSIMFFVMVKRSV
jgi:dipeptidyl aminopeptidase/acylaminoacyl peptidase